MSKSTSPTAKSTPVMLIDFKRDRIRVHKNTLHLMGDPDYIQFLINPENQTLAICISNSKDTLAHKVRWSLVSNGRCCEFYSKQLVYTIRNCFYPLIEQRAYRFYGEMIESEPIAFFSLAKPIPLEHSYTQNTKELCHE